MALRTVELRPALPSDDPLLRRIFLEVRRGEFPGIPAADLDPLLALQYRAHLAERRDRYPRAETSIILDAGEPAGTISIDRQGSRVHLVDIAVLADRRGRGIASRVISDLVAGSGRVTLSVWSLNHAARRLYERHGFEVVSEQFGYLLMATEADG